MMKKFILGCFLITTLLACRPCNPLRKDCDLPKPTPEATVPAKPTPIPTVPIMPR